MNNIIDADGHIVEPRIFWQEYLAPAFRERVPQIAKDSEGIDRVKVEGQILPRSPLMRSIANAVVPFGLAQDKLRRGSAQTGQVLASGQGRSA